MRYLRKKKANLGERFRCPAISNWLLTGGWGGGVRSLKHTSALDIRNRFRVPIALPPACAKKNLLAEAAGLADPHSWERKVPGDGGKKG